MKPLPRIILKSGREASLERFHPWVFSGAIERIDAGVEEGAVVQVFARGGKPLATGHYSGRGSIAVKVFAFGAVHPELGFWEQKLGVALELRKSLGLYRSLETTAWRLVNAEGDGFPGLIIDLYNSTAVMQFHSEGMWAAREVLTQALRNVLGDRLVGIYSKSARTLEDHEDSGGEEHNAYLWGRPGDAVIYEHGLKFGVDWERGQKTGFFLDQRENRALVGALSKGRDVLNAFCYTGGFSIYALAGGAKSVVSVDASKTAIAELERNVELGEFGAAHQALAADCFDYLDTIKDKFDIIILDPPAFAKHQRALRRARSGYERINQQGLSAIRDMGLLFTFSCSQLLSRSDFRDIVLAAAVKAKREVQVVTELSQAACHPVSLTHPEGSYLKGLLLRVVS